MAQASQIESKSNIFYLKLERFIKINYYIFLTEINLFKNNGSLISGIDSHIKYIKL